MAINFPNSPSVNDIHVSGANRWQWNGSSWTRIGGVSSDADVINSSNDNSTTTLYPVMVTGTGDQTAKIATTANKNLKFNAAEGDLTVGGDMTVLGTTTVQKIESELTQSFTIFDSGSSIFGDTSDDSHRFSGSFSPSGSISLNNYSVHNISNDTSMTDGSATEIITENVAKTYIDNTGHENFQTYLKLDVNNSTHYVSW